MNKIGTSDLVNAITALTQVVQPAENKVAFFTQNTNQAFLYNMIQELKRRMLYDDLEGKLIFEEAKVKETEAKENQKRKR